MKKLSLILFNLLIFITLPTLSISSDKIILGKAKVIDVDTIKINKKKLDFLVSTHQKNGGEI